MTLSCAWIWEIGVSLFKRKRSRTEIPTARKKKLLSFDYNKPIFAFASI